MLAVANGRPETLGLKQIIEHHVDFQFELATRKYTTLLKENGRKSEVQEGLIKACDVIDLIIEILRGSKSVKDAKPVWLKERRRISGLNFPFQRKWQQCCGLQSVRPLQSLRCVFIV